MKRKEIIETAKKSGISHLSFLKNQNIKAMKGYFYRGQGGTIEALVSKVKEAFPSAEIIETGDHFTAFRGGAPVSKQSHIYVEFSLK